MKNSQKITVLGGDLRLYYTADYLSHNNDSVFLYATKTTEPKRNIFTCDTLEKAVQADILVLPLPLSKDNHTLFAPFARTPIELKTVTQHLPSGTLVFGGNISDGFFQDVTQKGAQCFDYFKDEALTIKNAAVTAEGIAEILLSDLPDALFTLKVGIVGYGRVGSLTAKLLKNAGARVTVFARHPVSRANAELNGHKTRNLSYLSEQQTDFDVLINTVPFPVVGEKELIHLNRGCFLLETASAPYGIDRKAAEKMGFDYKNAPGLPGNTAPKTAGVFIAQAIERMIKEVNV